MDLRAGPRSRVSSKETLGRPDNFNQAWNHCIIEQAWQGEGGVRERVVYAMAKKGLMA